MHTLFVNTLDKSCTSIYIHDIMTPIVYHQPKPTKNQRHNSENFAPIKKQIPTFSTNNAWKTKFIQISHTGKEKKRRKTNTTHSLGSVKNSSESKNLMNGLTTRASRKPRELPFLAFKLSSDANQPPHRRESVVSAGYTVRSSSLSFSKTK